MTHSPYEDLRYGADRGIATITLARPAKLNALRVQTYDELLRALREAGADETVGVVVVRGAGRAFCAGGDIEMAQSVPVEPTPPSRAPQEPAPVHPHSSIEMIESHQGRSADAPLCLTCGTKMRPAGSCYVCEGCGSTSGCS